MFITLIYVAKYKQRQGRVGHKAIWSGSSSTLLPPLETRKWAHRGPQTSGVLVWKAPTAASWGQTTGMGHLPTDNPLEGHLDQGHEQNWLRNGHLPFRTTWIRTTDGVCAYPATCANKIEDRLNGRSQVQEYICFSKLVPRMSAPDQSVRMTQHNSKHSVYMTLSACRRGAWKYKSPQRSAYTLDCGSRDSKRFLWFDWRLVRSGNRHTGNLIRLLPPMDWGSQTRSSPLATALF